MSSSGRGRQFLLHSLLLPLEFAFLSISLISVDIMKRSFFFFQHVKPVALVRGVKVCAPVRTMAPVTLWVVLASARLAGGVNTAIGHALMGATEMTATTFAIVLLLVIVYSCLVFSLAFLVCFGFSGSVLPLFHPPVSNPQIKCIRIFSKSGQHVAEM